MKTTLQITYQDGSTPRIVSYAELLTCQTWTGYNRERLERLCLFQLGVRCCLLHLGLAGLHLKHLLWAGLLGLFSGLAELLLGGGRQS